MSASEFMERLFGDLSDLIEDEDHLRLIWSDPDNREHFLTQLSDSGYDTDRLNDIRKLVDAPHSDLFDVLGYVLYTSPPKTRQDRAEQVRQSDLSSFTSEMQLLLLSILQVYEDVGVTELATKKLGHFLTAKYGSVSEGKSKLGELGSIKAAYFRMQTSLYSR